MDYRFKISLQARNDLRVIWQRISRDDVSNATNFCDELLLLAESLKTFPDRHGSFAKRPYIRKLPYQSYLIVYKIDEAARTVEILRFWHAARDQRRLRLREESLTTYSSSPAAGPAVPA